MKVSLYIRFLLRHTAGFDTAPRSSVVHNKTIYLLKRWHDFSLKHHTLFIRIFSVSYESSVTVSYMNLLLIMQRTAVSSCMDA